MWPRPTERWPRPGIEAVILMQHAQDRSDANPAWTSVQPDAIAVTAATGTIRALLIDPSLFTAPYDAALTQGLLDAGVNAVWATRPVRRGDRQELPAERVMDFFYRRSDQAAWLPDRVRPLVKGVAHLAGLLRLLVAVRRFRPEVVHIQWVVLPLLDALAMSWIGRRAALVLTVHDTVPYNGQRMGWLQRMGFLVPLRRAHRLIVHTRSGRQALLDRGIGADKVSVIPHGPLSVSVPAPVVASRDARWTFVLFGEIKPYKGLDVLIEACALLPGDLRRQARFVVAGRPRMDLTALIERIDRLGLQQSFDLRLRRQSEEEMSALFAEADCFVFPYRQIDASGVYYLVKSLGKWLIASEVGIFAEDLRVGVAGELVPCEDAPRLAQALAHSLRTRAGGQVSGGDAEWREIGQATRTLYLRAMADRPTRR